MVPKAGVRPPEVLIPQFSLTWRRIESTFAVKGLSLAQILVSTLILVGRSSKLVPHLKLSSLHEQTHTLTAAQSC
jgi:hypothetical protein